MVDPFPMAYALGCAVGPFQGSKDASILQLFVQSQFLNQSFQLFLRCGSGILQLLSSVFIAAIRFSWLSSWRIYRRRRVASSGRLSQPLQIAAHPFLIFKDIVLLSVERSDLSREIPNFRLACLR